MIEPIDFSPQNVESRVELQRFLMKVQALLSELVQNEKCSELFYPDAKPLIDVAWPEIDTRFNEYVEMVGSCDEAILEHHGLTGQQLVFKLKAVNLIAGMFFDQIVKGAHLLARTLLKKLLEIIDKVLRSLISAVPGGDAIGEYKDIVESLVDDTGAYNNA